MFPKPPNGSQTQEYFLEERHCILVAASNPFPLPMPLYLPKVNKGFSGIQMESCMADAKAVAGLFPQVALQKLLCSFLSFLAGYASIPLGYLLC
jgi:mediator of RNA polymerase II transcription subunit 25